MSERRACRVLGHPRSTQRYEPAPSDYEQDLTADIVELASRFGRYGYRRITALLRERGWAVNHKRVERIWRREGLKVPHRHRAGEAVAQRRVMRTSTAAQAQPRVGL